MSWYSTGQDNQSTKQINMRRVMVDYFKDLGVSAVEFAEYSYRLEEIAKKVRRSDLTYLLGGIPGVLVERLKNAKVDSPAARIRQSDCRK